MDKRHRVEYYDNGNKFYEEFYGENRCMHREDGPALTTWLPNGKIDHQQYWFKGEKYTAEEFYRLRMKRKLNDRLNPDNAISTLTHIPISANIYIVKGARHP